MDFLKCRICGARIKVDSVASRKIVKEMPYAADSLLEASFLRLARHHREKHFEIFQKMLKIAHSDE